MAFVFYIIIFSLSLARADFIMVPEGAIGSQTKSPAVTPSQSNGSSKPKRQLDPQTPPSSASTPAPRKTPTCSSRTDEVKEMISKVMNTNVFDISWREDVPKVGNSGRFIVKDVKGSVRINMINGDGHSVGVAPARFCLSKSDGQLKLNVGLQRSFLRFGKKFGFIDLDSQVDELLAKLPNPSELPLVVTPGQDDTKIHIADGMGGETIDSEFSQSAR